ncbi:MBL fold metallo-hydrolase [Kordiimonas pumila]|uniref:MBL fold metallo-hydrolase n=1 Tax=Kordiimonas pumila TaxID=2161677 RepID=A0ABV7D633_9PROT|nr:MBL fold metallo-hydrolase [Kordiimonas pumila]
MLANNPNAYTGPGTNTYIVGEETLWIIDPGPEDIRHVDAVLAVVDGRPVAGILVTHTHMDHSPAAHLLKAAMQAPTYGYGPLCQLIAAETEEDVDTCFSPDNSLSHGTAIGMGRWRVIALHTPGHFPNHMCYVLPEQGVLFSGDHVMAWSTTAIVPPLGNFLDYMNSLDLLENVHANLMLPSHGCPVYAPFERIDAVRKHRHKRHNQVRMCLQAGVGDVHAIVGSIYKDADLTPSLYKAAYGCVQAHIDHLNVQGIGDPLEQAIVEA